MIFERIKAAEDAIVEVFFAQLIPDMLDGVEFGRVGR